MSNIMLYIEPNLLHLFHSWLIIAIILCLIHYFQKVYDVIFEIFPNFKFSRKINSVNIVQTS